MVVAIVLWCGCGEVVRGAGCRSTDSGFVSRSKSEEVTANRCLCLIVFIVIARNLILETRSFCSPG